MPGLPDMRDRETRLVSDAGRPPHWLLAVLGVCLLNAPGAAAAEANPYISFDMTVDAPASLQQAIERSLDIRSWKDFEYVTPELLDQLVEAAEHRIHDALESEGYFSAHIDMRIDTSVEPRMVRASIRPGEPARIASVAIDFAASSPPTPRSPPASNRFAPTGCCRPAPCSGKKTGRPRSPRWWPTSRRSPLPRQGCHRASRASKKTRGTSISCSRSNPARRSTSARSPSPDCNAIRPNWS